MNFRTRVKKFQDKNNKKINHKSFLSSLVVEIEKFVNKKKENQVKVKHFISLTNQKNLVRNFSSHKVQKLILFRDKSQKPKARLQSALQNKNNIRKNYSIENFKPNNASNQKTNLPNLVKNNDFKRTILTTEKKEKAIKCRIRPFSSYHVKVNEERKNIIKPKNLFNNIKNNYHINFIKLQKNVNKVSAEKKIIEWLGGNKDIKKNQFKIRKHKIEDREETNKNNKTNIKEEEKENISIEKEKNKKDEQKNKIRIEEEEKRKKEEENKKKEEVEEQKEKLIKEELKEENESPKKPNSIFDQKLCDEIVSTLPKRKHTTLKKFKKLIKSKTENLSEKERAFVLFKWTGQNIDYDVKNKNLGKRVDCSKEGVFKTGKTVCSGFSNLYQDIALYLDLNVVCIPCYAKGAGYIPGEKITALSTNHEYNAINLDGKWYPIDATWGAGHSNGNKYIREFNPFYFLADPELLIKTHFPSDEKWQLTEKTYKLSEFEKWPEVYSEFYQFGFRHFYPEEGYFELNNTNSTKFILYGEDMKKKGVMCSISLLGDNNKERKIEEKLSFINFFDDRIEISCSFNKKGKYLISLLGNKGDSLTHTSIISYTVKVANNSKNIMTYPETYNGHKLINIIEPLNAHLKLGENVKFKMVSDIEEIFISGTDIDETLVKNEEGFFEKDIIIKGKSGGKISIGKTDGFIRSTYFVYKIVSS